MSKEKQWMGVAGDAVMQQDLPGGHHPSFPPGHCPGEAEEHKGTWGPFSFPSTP